MPGFVRVLVREAIEWQRYRRWTGNDDGPAPHFYKRRVCGEVAVKYGCKSFVETGTYYGDMVQAMRRFFRRLISVEVYEPLFRLAKHRFADDPRITILQGDSSERMPEMQNLILGRALFWLDGHYSGEGTGTAADGGKCPIFKELEGIALNPRNDHCILIDDARAFVGEGGYPTMEQLKMALLELNPEYRIDVEHDIVRALPPIAA